MSFCSEAYLKPCETTKMELFEKLVTVNCFSQKVPSYILDKGLNMPLVFYTISF